MRGYVGTFLLALSVASAAADGDHPSPLRRRAREDLSFTAKVPTVPGVNICDVYLWVSCATSFGGAYAPCASAWSLPSAFGCEADLQVLVFVRNLGEEKMAVVNMTTWLDDEAEVLVSGSPGHVPVEIPVGGSIIRWKTITANVCGGGNHALTTVIFGSYLDDLCYDVDQMEWE